MTDENFTLSIQDVVTIANEILAIEDKNLKRWSKIPRFARGEDLTRLIKTHFPDLDSDDITWTALWVDVYISLCHSSEKGEMVALLSYEEIVQIFMDKTEEDLNYFESELEWISEFGCLLTEGSGSDIGAWFFDPMWDRLYEIEAIATFDYLYDDGVSLEEITTLATSDKPINRAKAANIGSTPSELLTKLSKDSSAGVRFVVAQNSNTPSETLSKLAADEDESVRISAICNPSAPQKIVEDAAKSPNETLRQAAAASMAIQTSHLLALSKDKSEYVRLKVARNENATAEILDELARDKSQDVREAVAENSNTSEKTLKYLCGDKEYLVRLTIAYRDDLTEELREILAKDKKPSVREALD